MEKLKLNLCLKDRKSRQVKRAGTLEPKSKESGHSGLTYTVSNGQSIPGLEEAPKVSTIIYNSKHGKTVTSLN